MAAIGNGYGSECHLLRYLGRHRARLDGAVRETVDGTDRVTWLDFPFDTARDTWQDAEWKGLDFVQSAATQAAWREFWPNGSGIMNWDAVGLLHRGAQQSWLLVEAKAHVGELLSSCGAKADESIGQINRALGATKAKLGVSQSADWTRDYYQAANRLAVLSFLQDQGIDADLLFIYFNGDRDGSGRECPATASAWTDALTAQNEHLGLPTDHALADRVHKLFLPVAG